MRKIDLIVLHCSATRETQEYTPEQLERDHKARGFVRAGYNYYIRRSGEIVPMRPIEQVPARMEPDAATRRCSGSCARGSRSSGSSGPADGKRSN